MKERITTQALTPTNNQTPPQKQGSKLSQIWQKLKDVLRVQKDLLLGGGGIAIRDNHNATTLDVKYFEKACTKIALRFAHKHNLRLEFFVTDDVVSFGDIYIFNLIDIYYDLNTNQPKGLILEWCEAVIEHHETKGFISFVSYSKGLRYE